MIGRPGSIGDQSLMGDRHGYCDWQAWTQWEPITNGDEGVATVDWQAWIQWGPIMDGGKRGKYCDWQA